MKMLDPMKDIFLKKHWINNKNIESHRQNIAKKENFCEK